MYRQEEPPTSGSFSTSSSTSESYGRTGDSAEQIKEQAKDVAGQVQQQAGALKDQAAEKATSQLEDRKGMAAESIVGVADALRQTSGQLRDQDRQAFAQYADQAADKVEHLASYLREQDVNQIFEEVERFARRQPMLFMGGAFALGVLAARFMKASRPETYGDQARFSSSYGSADYSGGYRSYTGTHAPTYSQPRTYSRGASATGGDYTGRRTWETGATGRSTESQTPGFSRGSSAGANYPEMDTGFTTQGHKDTPGAPERNTGYPGGKSVTGATGRGTGNVTRPTGTPGSYRNPEDTEAGELGRDSNATG